MTNNNTPQPDKQNIALCMIVRGQYLKSYTLVKATDGTDEHDFSINLTSNLFEAMMFDPQTDGQQQIELIEGLIFKAIPKVKQITVRPIITLMKDRVSKNPNLTKEKRKARKLQ